MAIMDTLSGYIPSFNIGGAISTIIYAIILVIVLALMGWGTWWYVQKKRFDKLFILYEKVGKGFEVTQRSPARFIFIGNVNDRVFLVKKPKMVLPAPTLQTGRNIFYFFRRSDGEIVNWTPPDLDVVSEMNKAEMTNQEIAYQRLALEEFAKQRVTGKNWFLENIGMLVGFMVILIVLVFLWLILGKMTTISSTTADTIVQSTKLQQSNTELVRQLSEIMNRLGINGTSGSVVTPVDIPTTS